MTEDENRERDRILADAREWRKSNLAQIQAFASDAMKAPGLVAIGGVAAVLGFYSANYARLSAAPGSLEHLNDALYWLFASLLFTTVMPALAYLSQVCFEIHDNKHVIQRQPPYRRSIALGTFIAGLGQALRILAAFLFVGSVSCLLIGGYAFLALVK